VSRLIPPPLLSRIRLVGLLLVLTLLGLGWGIWRSIAPEGTDPDGRETVAFRRPSAIPFTDVHPWGANFFLEREVERFKAELTVEYAREAGLGWARQHVLWSEVQPAPGTYDWSKYDRLVDVYRSAGMDVIMRLDWAPQWAVGEGYRLGINNLPADFAEFATFAGAAAEHFRGRVRLYQVWNEPNLSLEWGGAPANAEEYARMLALAAEAIRAADPNAVVMVAPLAINLESVEMRGNESDLEYLDKLYEAGAAEHFDVLVANAFGMDRSPGDPPAEDVLNFRRVELQRRVMVRHGDGDKALWIGEYGWNAAPPDLDDLPWQRVDEAAQAAFTVEGVEYAERNWTWSGVFNVWYFRQEGRIGPERADFYFRMLSVDFTPQRLYAAVQADAAARRRAGPGIWEERSSPVRLGRHDDWLWQSVAGARDGNALVSRALEGSTAPELRLEFEGTEVAARLERGPQAGTIEVHVDGRQVSSLVLTQADRAWSLEPLARELAPGVHELRIVVGATGGGVVLDYLQVDSHPLTVPPYGVPLALAALALALGAWLVADLRAVLRRVRL